MTQTNRDNKEDSLYGNNVAEFVTVAAGYCTLLEECNTADPRTFTEQVSRISALLYLKASLLPSLISTTADEMQSFVTEDDYNSVREKIWQTLGEKDDFLDTQTDDMQYSETALPATISENLTDVYQDLKDMIMNFKTANKDVMTEAIIVCKDNFQNLWGQKLISALGAMHHALYSPSSEWTATNNNMAGNSNQNAEI